MTPLAQTLKAWFAIHPSAARIAEALYRADGAVVTWEHLQHVSGQTRNGVDGSIKRLRDAMDAGSIRNRFGEGYWFTEKGLEDCRAAIRDAETRAAA